MQTEVVTILSKDIASLRNMYEQEMEALSAFLGPLKETVDRLSKRVETLEVEVDRLLNAKAATGGTVLGPDQLLSAGPSPASPLSGSPVAALEMENK